MNRAEPITKDIVLVGGGHAHVHVLTTFAMRPLPGLRATLVTRELATPYSGMLPGVVAGLYAPAEAHIDLVRLSAATGTRLIHAEANGLDRVNRRILLKDRPPIAYDVLSIDVGIAPALDQIPGADEHGIAVKPIGGFLHKFGRLVAQCRKADGPRRMVLIGGGAGGVELLLSVRTRLLAEASDAGIATDAFVFTLVTAGEILATHNTKVRTAFRRVLSARDIACHEHRRVSAVRADAVECDNGEVIGADAILVTTAAAAPSWFAGTGLDLDRNGFIAVGPTLRSTNDPNVFAAGDCAALTASPREKAGVYAVRAGKPLAENLRRRARGEQLKDWHPQRRHLALISTGDRYAVASRDPFKAEGTWLWSIKDWIDRRWMQMYQDIDEMQQRMPAPAAAPVNAADDMRCGGCAAKIGPGPLSRALARLAPGRASSDVLIGLDARDDAAVLAAPVGKNLVQTVDFFRTFIDDPFVFGEIAANHALNDIFAMGGVPRFALATAVVPAGPSAKVEEDLFQLLAGARACLDREGVALVGGHSSEGADLALGLSLTGEIAPDGIVRKGGLKSGDALILTRPLGTGILFAAAMRARCKAAWIEAAIHEMRLSNRAAAAVLIAHGATAMTDVTGFGLVGHLGEILKASGVGATLDLSAVPLYAGVLPLACGGIASTLLPENLWLADVLRGDADGAARAILFDPQTSGGLLAGIPAAHAQDCVAALIAEGHGHASIVGRILDSPEASGIKLIGALA